MLPAQLQTRAHCLQLLHVLQAIQPCTRIVTNPPKSLCCCCCCSAFRLLLCIRCCCSAFSAAALHSTLLLRIQCCCSAFSAMPHCSAVQLFTHEPACCLQCSRISLYSMQQPWDTRRCKNTHAHACIAAAANRQARTSSSCGCGSCEEPVVSVLSAAGSTPAAPSTAASAASASSAISAASSGCPSLPLTARPASIAASMSCKQRAARGMLSASSYADKGQHQSALLLPVRMHLTAACVPKAPIAVHSSCNGTQHDTMQNAHTACTASTASTAT